MLLGTGVWALVQISKNLDPVKIALQISSHIEKTQAKLDAIDQTTLGNDRKIELLMSIAHRNEAMLREARQAGLDMSGELHKIQKTIDVAIREVSKH
jgi:ABC-type uncharacterized transport system ATPase subunit